LTIELIFALVSPQQDNKHISPCFFTAQKREYSSALLSLPYFGLRYYIKYDRNKKTTYPL
jgi:hypothetical protein